MLLGDDEARIRGGSYNKEKHFTFSFLFLSIFFSLHFKPLALNVPATNCRKSLWKGLSKVFTQNAVIYITFIKYIYIYNYKIFDLYMGIVYVHKRNKRIILSLYVQEVLSILTRKHFFFIYLLWTWFKIYRISGHWAFCPYAWSDIKLEKINIWISSITLIFVNIVISFIISG